MRCNILRLILLNIAFIFLTGVLWAKSPLGHYRSIDVMQNLDTVVYNHFYSDWWYGATGGISSHYYFGNLNLPRNPTVAVANYNQIIPLEGTDGFGYFFGLESQWVPVEESWGGGLSLVYDRRGSTSESNRQNDSVRSIYVAESAFDYIIISPFARYNFELEGMYSFFGANFYVPMGNLTEHYKKFTNTGAIEQKSNVELEKNLFRYGFSLGLAYDIAGGGFGDARIRFTPYFSLHAGSSVSDINNSNLNSIYFKGGVSVKFGPDEIIVDTLPFDPNYVPPPTYFASANYETGSIYPGYNPEEVYAARLDVVDYSRIIGEVREEPVIAMQETIRPQVEKPKEIIDVSTNEVKVFTYPSSSSTNLSPEMRAYLDAIAEFAERNPRSEVRIVGHSDNRGTSEENQRRSELRARQVVRYLLSKGIPRGRLLDRGMGDRLPVADTRTDEGRAKNRRVEIQVVQ